MRVCTKQTKSVLLLEKRHSPGLALLDSLTECRAQVIAQRKQLIETVRKRTQSQHDRAKRSCNIEDRTIALRKYFHRGCTQHMHIVLQRLRLKLELVNYEAMSRLWPEREAHGRIATGLQEICKALEAISISRVNTRGPRWPSSESIDDFRSLEK